MGANTNPGLDGRDPRGQLVLIGGACTLDGHAFESFITLSGAREGSPIVGLTTASEDPAESARHWTDGFHRVGAANVHFPILTRGDPASEADIADRILDANGVFLGGGNQVILVNALRGTRVASAIAAVYARGGVVCGTSAGAAALPEYSMAGGEIDTEGNLVEQYFGPGLGLLAHDTIIDTHFSQRRRLQRLFLVIAKNTRLFGIGIDEDTGIIVRGELCEVVGAGGVTFVDGRYTVRYDNAAHLDAGRQLTLSHLRVGIIGTHHHLNLRVRDLHERETERIEKREPRIEVLRTQD